MIKRKNNIIKIVAWLFLTLFILICILFATSNKTTFSSINLNTNEYAVLTCQKNIENSTDLFYTNAKKVTEEIKAVYMNNTFHDLLMTYYGEYNDKNEAKHAETLVHSAYNIYTGSLKVSNTKFSPSYNIVDNTMKMTLYVNADENLFILPRAFYIESFNDKFEMNKEDLKKYYETHNFTCFYN